jgi:dihydropyrimidinase
LIEIVSTDHAPFHRDLKEAKASMFDIPFGMPGVETLLPIMYTEGVAKGRLGIGRLVQLLSENPARRFGLYPRKGTLAPGADADIVVLDPARTHVLRHAELHGGYGFDPFEGWTVHSSVERVYLRGQQIVFSGRLLGEAGRGQFLPQSAVKQETLTL